MVRSHVRGVGVYVLVGVLGSQATPGWAQQVSYEHATAAQLAGIAKDNARHFGDDPEDGGPLATDLSAAMTHADVDKVTRKVADWQLKVAEPYFDRIWTWSVLYSGFMAASASTGDPKYRDAMERMGKKYEWSMRSKLPNADDQSVGQTYLELYLLQKDPAEIGPSRQTLDERMATPYASSDPNRKIEWWWCDALFMGPPVWVRMYKATGDKKYLTYLDEEWAKTSDLLYDPTDHLFARDASYLAKTEANGKRMYWSRGEGWVMGGIARTLEYLPKDDVGRAKYERQMREMSAKLASLQGADGLWRAGLLDAEHYALPEVSGSALITFGMAWGINNGVLDAKVYRPVVEKAWAGMLKHVYADGRLGCIQQTGAEPAPFRATASYTYGVGGFLLAASEVRKLGETGAVKGKKVRGGR